MDKTNPQTDGLTLLYEMDSPVAVKEKFRRYFSRIGKWNVVAILDRLILSIHYLKYEEDWGDAVVEIKHLVVTCVIAERMLREYAIAEEPGPEGDRQRNLKRELAFSACQMAPCGTFTYCNIVVVTSDHLSGGDKGLNNCYFEAEQTIKHDRLLFRSKSEIAIYDELRKRFLLFLPNAAAVIVGEKWHKEPDFLICNKGKWGVLEVMGDGWHHNASKDHDRARLFKEHGVLCVEFFNADECTKNPASVVDKFLGILAQH